MDCKGVCNAPASKTIFRMRMPSMKDALAGKWPTWVQTSGRSYEEMPIGRVFADAVLLPNGQVRARVCGGMQRRRGRACELHMHQAGGQTG